MPTSAVTAASTTSSSASASAMSAISSDDFLTLLVTELQMQDPMDPMDTEGMVQQLSQMEMVAETRLSREAQEVTQALSLIGHTVQWEDSATGASCSGTVESVRCQDSTAYLMVGDNQLKLDDILAIS